MKPERQVHEAAGLLPMMSDKEYGALKASIKASGLLNPIAVLPDGTVLDGRHRLRACNELGVTPAFVTVAPQDPSVFVIEQNILRRHLSAGQRAAVMARQKELVARLKAEAKDRHGGDRRSSSNKATACRLGQYRGQLAKIGHTNTMDMQRALTVRERLPELLDQVIGGTMKLKDAYEQAKKNDHRKPNPIPKGTATLRQRQLRAAAKTRHAEWRGLIDSIPSLLQRTDADLIAEDGDEVVRWRRVCRLAVKAINKFIRKLPRRP